MTHYATHIPQNFEMNHNTFDSVSISQYFREIASKEYILPNGKVAKYSPYTFKKWYLSYKNNGIDWNDYSSLEELNSAFNVYLNEKYINVVHSSVNNTPRKRYLEDKDKIKYIPTESLEEHFLHRITRKVNKDCTVKIQTKDFEVSAKYIGQRINVRYSPNDNDKAYIFDMNNKLTDIIYPLNRIDNSKVKRKILDYLKR